MTGLPYKVTRNIPALVSGEHHPEIISIPAGEVITRVGRLVKDPRLIRMYWNGRKVLAFAVDLTERTVLVRGQAAGK